MTQTRKSRDQIFNTEVFVSCIAIPVDSNMPRHPGPELKILPGPLEHFSDRAMHIFEPRIGKLPEIAAKKDFADEALRRNNKKIDANCNQGASAQFVALALFRVPTFLVALEPKEPRSSTVKSKG